MNPEREARLDTIGFVWKVCAGRPKGSRSRLVSREEQVEKKKRLLEELCFLEQVEKKRLQNELRAVDERAEELKRKIARLN
jgi:hypothetical protein